MDKSLISWRISYSKPTLHWIGSLPLNVKHGSLTEKLMVSFELAEGIQPPPVCGGVGIRAKTFQSEPAGLFVSMFPDFALAGLSGEGQVFSVTQSKVRNLATNKASHRRLSVCGIIVSAILICCVFLFQEK